jgi:signal transduction histidine kinase
MLNFKGERVLEEYSRPHRVGDQTVGRVYTFHDVTAREKATTQLAGLAGIRQKLLEAAHAGGLVLWCLGEDSLLLSENAAEVLDLQSGEVPGDLPALEALIHPDELDRFRQALEHPTAGSFEVRMRKGSGIWIWTRWNLERDQELGYRGSFRDYTAHRRAEEAFADLRRTMGMAFLAENSTRIQGPIIRNAQEALAEIAQGGPLDEAQQAGLRRAQGAIGEMEAFLREGTMATRCEPDTSRLLDFGMLEETFRAQTEPCLGSGIRLKVHFASRLPALAMNEAHLRLALLDLCLNARDALQGNGTITLSLEPGRPEGLWVEVRDDGPGIPPAVLNRMFDPFFSTGKNAHGLGLTVVKAIVEAYHGTIQVESQPGEGTCVRLQLPAGN